ncbi:hypothetical protein BJV74DRAFT_303984 [Russula compacta]|nr:hypothetical protein BJV74DRAFT_303984 [Russula compacta]
MRSLMQFRIKNRCIWYLLIPQSRLLIRSFTTRMTRMQSLLAFKSRRIGATLLLSKVFGIFKAGSKTSYTTCSSAPFETRPWRFLFVVPSNMFLTFINLQNLKGDTPTGVWATKVHQYVLGVEEQTIFGKKRSDSGVQRAITPEPGEQTSTVLNICL